MGKGCRGCAGWRAGRARVSRVGASSGCYREGRPGTTRLPVASERARGEPGGRVAMGVLSGAWACKGGRVGRAGAGRGTAMRGPPLHCSRGPRGSGQTSSSHFYPPVSLSAVISSGCIGAAPGLLPFCVFSRLPQPSLLQVPRTAAGNDGRQCRRSPAYRQNDRCLAIPSTQHASSHFL